jgi:hypothetical protein
MKKLLMTATALVALATPAMAQPPLPTGLNAKIVRAEAAGGGRLYMYPLVVVSNQSSQTYKVTEWSCGYFLNGEPVHEDTFLVKQVAANGRTLHKTVTDYHRFSSTECRLISVNEND